MEREEDIEQKLTKEEKKMISTQEKLEKLRQKIQENPPKTIWGRNKNLTKLRKLQNIIRIQKLKIESKNRTSIDQTDAFDIFDEKTKEIPIELSDIDTEMANIASQIERLEKNENRYQGITERVQNAKPENYVRRTSKSAEPETVLPKSIAAKKIEELKEIYAEKEAQRKKLMQKFEEAESEYNNKLLQIEEQAFRDADIIETEKYLDKRELSQEMRALRQTTGLHPIQSIRNFGHKSWDFIKKAVNKVKEKATEWNANRKANKQAKMEEAQGRLDEALNNGDGEGFNIKVEELSLEEQRAYSRQVQDKFTAMGVSHIIASDKEEKPEEVK